MKGIYSILSAFRKPFLKIYISTSYLNPKPSDTQDQDLQFVKGSLSVPQYIINRLEDSVLIFGSLLPLLGNS